MGCCFSFRLNWLITVPLATVAQLFGKIGYLYMTSYLLNEDLPKIILSNF